jgi:hypothetical protein
MAMYVRSGSPDAAAFYAWGFDSRTESPASPPTQFDVPVGSDSGLNLSFEFDGASAVQERGLTPEHREFFTHHVIERLTPHATQGRPKLMRGIYLLTWSGADDDPIPKWRGYGMEVVASAETRQSPGGKAEDEGADESGTQLYSRLAPPALSGRRDFPYLLVSIDYAGSQGSLKARRL